MNVKYIITVVCLFCCLIGRGEIIYNKKLPLPASMVSTSVKFIEQDATGFLWFGTSNGLFRYDGYSTMRIVPRNDAERRMYSDVRIQEMRMCNDRFLLMRLRGGINCMYDTGQNRFVDYTGNGSYSVPYQDFVITSQQDFWLVESASGMGAALHVVFDKKTDTFSSKKLEALPQDIRTKLQQRHHQRQNRMQQWEQMIRQLTADNPSLQLSPYIKTVFEDADKDLFVSEEDRGITFIKPMPAYVRYMYNADADLTHANVIRMVYADQGSGITMLSQSDDVMCVAYDRDGRRWEATRENGVRVDGRNYMHSPSDARSIGPGKVCYVCADRKGRMWITLFDGGLELAHPDGKGGLTFEHLLPELSMPRMMLCDRHGQLWICTSQGTVIYNPDTRKTVQLAVGSNDLKSNESHALYEDSKGRMWVGTIGYGIAMIDNSIPGKPRIVKVFTMSNGLSNDNVQSITEDSKGRIWAGTDYGLSVFDEHEGCWLRFYPAANDMGMMFCENSVCRLSDGMLAFGTKHGVALINPAAAWSTIDTARKNAGRNRHVLCLTDIIINGMGMEKRTTPALPSSLSLAYNENSVEFRVSDFDYASGERTTYQFWLEGCDSTWLAPQTTNARLYDNLSPGDYVLHVRAFTENGIPLAGEITLDVTVAQVWYLTWWAMMIYLCLAVTFVVVVWHHWREREALRMKIRVEEEMTRLKTHFFTNISHEFRTPLTIIHGEMEKLWKGDVLTSDQKQSFSAMKRSSDRMSRLIVQLMDFSKIHEGRMRLRVQDTDVVDFVREIFNTFHGLAERKGITMHFRMKEKSIMAHIDREYVDKILYNLISNALKYTHAGGEVTVSVADGDGKVTIKVYDTGIGISEEQRGKLFSRFDQSAIVSDSIGLGLHLTRRLTERHHGVIVYTDNEPHGSVFSVSLPASLTAYAEDERMAEQDSMVVEAAPGSMGESAIPSNYEALADEPINRQTVMVVEDDMDIQAYLENILGVYFNIVLADNGRRALDMMLGADGAKPMVPDMIITDLIMPEMGGMEMVRTIFSKRQFARIPVIMLTALTDDSNQVKAYNMGVDAFITKPFLPQVLVAKVMQLMNAAMLYNAPADESSADEASGPAEVSSSNASDGSRADNGRSAVPAVVIMDGEDKRFHDRFNRILEQHIGDSSLGVDNLAEAMGIGRTLLFKRVKELTGMSPNECIKQRRMELAMSLLSDDTLTIYQIASRIGMESAAYFSKIFKSVYGVTPSQYRKTGHI